MAQDFPTITDLTDRLGRKQQSSRLFAVLALLIVMVCLSLLVAMRIDVGVVRVTGEVIPEGNRDRVDHADGGTVDQVMVEEGQAVVAGQILLTLEDEELATRVRDLQLQRASVALQLARVDAELERRSTLTIPTMPLLDDPQQWGRLVAAHSQALVDGVATASATEQLHRSRLEEVAATERALSDEGAALEAERAALQSMVEMRRRLVEDGHVARAELLELQRSYASLEARIAVHRRRTEEVAAEQQTARDSLQQVTSDHRRTLTTARLDLIAEESRLTRDLAAASAALARTIVRSPCDGWIAHLPADRSGIVVPPRGTLFEVVARDAPLIVEAQLPVSAIGDVAIGREARVSIATAVMRQEAPLPARITSVNPDRHLSEAGTPFYRMLLEISPEALLPRPDAPLIAGMAVEVFVISGNRSLAGQLIQPVKDILATAWRQA